MSIQRDASPVPIDAALVRRLVAAQFPQWADLPVEPVLPGGWDNRTFRLGEDLSVRVPSAAGYVPSVEKEHRWLPELASRLPLPIPAPIAKGAPGAGYPWPWSVNRWLPGESAVTAPIDDMVRFARDLATFLVALEAIDASGGPAAGAHSFFRGAPPAAYDAETRDAIDALAGEFDPVLTTEIWERAIATTWSEPPVWFHGDVALGNLLVEAGRLSAVIDFGTSGVGDPACDTVIAWTLFDGESRAAFRAGLPLDSATYARGRGWALWKAMITVVRTRDTDPVIAGESRRVISEVIADHELER